MNPEYMEETQVHTGLTGIALATVCCLLEALKSYLTAMLRKNTVIVQLPLEHAKREKHKH